MTNPDPLAGIGKDCLTLNRKALEEAGLGDHPSVPPDPSKPNKAEEKAEDELQSQCEKALNSRKIQFLHLSKKAREKKGWPDLVFTLPFTFSIFGISCAVELKVGRRTTTPEQHACLTGMARNGALALVLRSYESFLELLNVRDMEGLWQYIARQTECFNSMDQDESAREQEVAAWTELDQQPSLHDGFSGVADEPTHSPAQSR